MFLSVVCALACSLLLSLAASATSTSPLLPQSTACGEIINNVTTQTQYIFTAEKAFKCLSSVPFNAAVASRFIKYYNDTLQFQSTLVYLKNPPHGYQQPPIDLLGGLEQIQRKIDAGVFPNQYQFEATLQTLLYSAHDKHIQLVSGVLSVFQFFIPHSVVSLSSDGKEPPRLYLHQHAYDNYHDRGAWELSPITTINGQRAEEFVSAFAAANSPGNLDPHADWNQLMYSPALDIQGFVEQFEAVTLYPGDSITFVLENGTQIGPDPWRALYIDPGPTGPLETGGDFYNFFVLGQYPASYDPDLETDSSPIVVTAPSNASSTPSAVATNSTMPSPAPGWDNIAYPSPNTSQDDLGTYGEGWISGYLLNDPSIAVISIPSFAESGLHVQTFPRAVKDFIDTSKAAGKNKVVIDLQQNSGGDVVLAVDTFKRFFPTIDPYLGSRMRAHQTANELGRILTANWSTLTPEDEEYNLESTNDWVITDRINPLTGQNFTTWEEFYGPLEANGDNFTNAQRYNFSSTIFASYSVPNADSWFSVYGLGANPSNSTSPFAAENIVILTDGLCDSACAIFVEMMHYEAGVRTVAVGGRPENGPMQATGGTRGADYCEVRQLDADIEKAKTIANRTGLQTIFPERFSNIYVVSASVNLLDQVRENQTTPLQFVYDAADCRIFYTKDTLYNYTNLWKHVANAVWTDANLCVQGSTGFATPKQQPISKSPPAPANATAEALQGEFATLGPFNHSITNAFIVSSDDGLQAIARDERQFLGRRCSPSAGCAKGYRCEPTPPCSQGESSPGSQCVPLCNNNSRCRVREGMLILTGQCIPVRGASWNGADNGQNPWAVCQLSDKQSEFCSSDIFS